MTQYDRFLGHNLSDRYTLVSIIGIGECSAVFGAFDRETGQTVALKMLAPDRLSDNDAVKRFLGEVEVLSLFDHPNIVKILDISLDGEYKFFVMEYIEGITLKKHILSKGALPEDEILFLSRPILSALEEVHTKGIVHCDIKPQNIVLVGSGEIKLMDFGISKTLASQNVEISEITVGTVQYVSPEQAEGKPLSPCSDLYSFGVTLYEMATGVLPFVDEDQSRIAAMQVSSQPIPPSMVCDTVSPELDALILCTMEKDPNARPQSALALLSELENLHTPKEQDPHEPEAMPDLQTIWKNLHKRTCFAGILCALFLTVVISLGGLSAALTKQKQANTFVRVPCLVGETYVSPAAFGLDEKLYSISVEHVSLPEKSGTVLEQYPAPDKVINRKGKPLEIKITVALRALPEQMPDVTYLKESEALAFLEGYDFKVNKIYTPHDYLPDGYVMRTEPMQGQAASREVTLYISQN